MRYPGLADGLDEYERCNREIAQGVKGPYQVIVGLVPSGKKPSVRNAIPGYLAQTQVVVQQAF